MSGADAASSQPLPVQLLRKYIAYARAHVSPVLSEEAKEALQVNQVSLMALPWSWRCCHCLCCLMPARPRLL